MPRPRVAPLGALRDAQSANEMLPYVSLTGSRRKGGAARRAVRDLESGWQTRQNPPIPLHPPIPWDHPGLDRSGRYALQAWHPAEALIVAHAHSGDAGMWRAVGELAGDWLRWIEDADDPMAWYDMAVGFRAYRLAYIIDAALRDPTFDEDTLAGLIDAVDDHALRLLADDEFAGHSNHGFFQVAGALAIATRLPWHPRSPTLASTAKARLDRMLRTHFADDGVHREHSPRYHALLLDVVAALAVSGLADDGLVDEFHKKIDRALAWFVLPDGTLAAFGDSERSFVSSYWKGQPLHPRRIRSRYRTPLMRHAASAGELGRAPTSRIKAFTSGGYFVAKPTWPTSTSGDGSYLAMQAGFHSRSHKHADDLALIWYDAGRHILVDAGRYGYVGKAPTQDSAAWREGSFYDDPKRRYVESTRAHNTVEIAERNFDRRREPYGSALETWGDNGREIWASAAIPIDPGRLHRRIEWRPASLLRVIDTLTGTGHRHAVQWWHFSPTFTVVREARGFAATDGNLTLRIESETEGRLVGPIVGQTEPRLQGWISPDDLQLVPNAAIGFAASTPSRIATTFTLQ